MSRKHIDFDTYLPFLLVSVGNAMTRSASRAYLARFGVGVTEWRILANLAAWPGITARSICATSSLDKAAVSRAVTTLAQRGLLAINETDDRRERRLTLSPAGAELHDRMLDVALERETRTLDGICEADRAALIRILKALRSAAGSLDDS